MEIIIMGFDAAGQLLTINIRHSYVIKNEVVYAVYNTINLHIYICTCCRSHWPHCLRRGSAAAGLLRLWVLILLGSRMSVVNVVCHQVEVSAMSQSLVQQSPTFYGVFECDSNTMESISLKFLYQY